MFSIGKGSRRRLILPAIFLLGFVVGELDPAGWLFWRVAEKKIYEMKEESLSKESPFETIPEKEWIARSERAFAVKDIKPQAPVHFLVIPKSRIESILDASPDLISEMLVLARETAVEQGIAEEGFRIVINTNPKGAQSVYHLHIHVLGGRQMRWPPG